MTYLTELNAAGIYQADIDLVAETWRRRAAERGEQAHPNAIYQTAAVDIAMGLIELHRETESAMQADHPVRSWLGIVTGVKLP